MFNDNAELNDFTPSWLKLPANGCRPTLNWLQDNACQSPKNEDAELQKDDFVPAGQRVISSVWGAPPRPPVAAQTTARGCPNRMYKAVLPQNFSKRVWSRTNSASSSQSVKDNVLQENNNQSPTTLPLCDEAEERLLREMGWDELQAEGPLTDEEITTFRELSRAILRHGQRFAAATDGVNNNNSHLNTSNIQQKPAQGGARRYQTGSDLKKTLLATMGVTPDSETDEDESDDG